MNAADLVAFTGVASEFSPLAVDETYARRSHFGGQVIPGSMVSAVAIGLGSLDVPLPASAGMVGMTWRYLAPVRPGDSIRAHFRLNRKRPVENPEWGLCWWQVEVENQHGTVVATGDVGRLVERRQPAEANHRFAPTVRQVAETVASAELPEPAPADAPPAARRRRRRGGRGRGGNGGQREPESESSAAPPAPAPAPEPSTGPQTSGQAKRRSILGRLFG